MPDATTLLRVPRPEKVAPLLLRMAQENGEHVPRTGSKSDIEVVPVGVPLYTDKKLSVADYGPTLDKVLIATNRTRFDVACNGKPFGYVIMRPGVDQPVEYGTSLAVEIAKYRDCYPGEVRLCQCKPSFDALWWPEAQRVVILDKIGPDADEWIGRFMSAQEFHAQLTGKNLNLAISWVLANEGIDAAIDVVIGVLDEWVEQGRFEAICVALRDAPEFYLVRAEDHFPHGAEIPPGTPPFVEDVTLALGFLTATSRAKELLGSARIGYYRRVEHYLRAKGDPEREELLRGLG